LISNFDRLWELAQGGGLEQLDRLYVSPGTAA
jgi:hypothetical protein